MIKNDLWFKRTSFSECGFADWRPLFAKRRVVISEIGWTRRREREVRGRQGIYDRTGVRFIITNFAISTDADFNAANTWRRLSMVCDWSIERRGRKKSRTTSFLRTMIVEETARRREEKRRDLHRTVIRPWCCSSFELLRSAVTAVADPFSIAQERSRDLVFSQTPNALWSLILLYFFL